MSFIGDLFGGDDTRQVEIAETNTSVEPPAFAKPFLERVLAESQTQFETPREFFPNQTFVDFSAPTLRGLDAGEARATAGSPLVPATQASVLRGLDFQNPANELLLQTARGDFLNRENPHLLTALQPALDAVQGQFSAAGRLGSQTNQDAALRALAPQLAQNFEKERDRQIAAQTALGGLSQRDAQIQGQFAQFAPQAAALDFDDIDRLLQFGQVRELKAAEQLADQIKRFNFAQEEPRDRLSDFATKVRGGTVGSQSTQTQPIFANPTSTGIGNIGTLATAGKAVNDIFKFFG